jgi:hypothetical protein
MQKKLLDISLDNISYIWHQSADKENKSELGTSGSSL